MNRTNFMKLALFSYLFAASAGAAFAQDVKAVPLQMDRAACANFEQITGFKPCVQYVQVIATSPSKDVIWFEITLEYTDAQGARRSQVAVVKAGWQSEQSVGSYFFTGVDDAKDIKATAIAQGQARRR